MEQIVYFDIVSLFCGVRQKKMTLRDALAEVVACRDTGHQWAIHNYDGVLLAETKGMKQAVIDAFASGSMS